MAEVAPPLDPSTSLRMSGPAQEGVYDLRGVPPLLTFAHVSLSETVRLNTGDPGSESGSTAK